MTATQGVGIIEMVTTVTASAKPSASGAPAASSPGQPRTLKLGGPAYTYPDGLAVQVSDASPYKPTEGAADRNDFKDFVEMTVTLTNGTAESYAPVLFIDTLQSGDADGDRVIDFANGIQGSPAATLLPGQIVPFQDRLWREGSKDPGP